jgi:hypothetical protein
VNSKSQKTYPNPTTYHRYMRRSRCGKPGNTARKIEERTALI